MTATTATTTTTSTTSRRAKLKVLSIVHNYNMHMGSVDLSNILSDLYRVNRKSRNWTKRRRKDISEQQPMKFYCEKVGGVSGEIGSTPTHISV
ncbi:hypothetical protein T06_5465 [Trichinella sp. T6]|nr:hypothetical protein T06_5465 [Trichinella sp. T6]